MGQGALSKQILQDTQPNSRRLNFIKKIFKYGLLRKSPKLGKTKGKSKNSFPQEYCDRNPVIPFTHSDYALSLFFISPHVNQARRSKHSLVSYALSKLASLTKLSKEKLKESKSAIKKRFSFHKAQISPPDITPVEQTNNDTKIRKITSIDLNNNPQLKAKLIKRILSSKCSAKTSEEVYQRNLDKFDKLVAITAISTSEEEDYYGADAADMNKNFKPPRRIIATSKNRVEVDANFLEWVKSKVSGTKQNKTEEEEATEESVSNTKTTAKKDASGVATTTVETAKTKTKPLSSRTATRETSLATSKTRSIKTRPLYDEDTADTVSRTNTTSVPWSKSTTPGTQQKFTVFQATTTAGRPRSGSGSESSFSDMNNNNTTAKSKSVKSKRSKRTRKNKNNGDNTEKCTKRGSCGKACKGPAAPPVYLDYGSAASTAGAFRRGQKDPVIDRLKNVDVVEELTYMVPNPCGGPGEGKEEDDCDYYALCEDCGELEPLPEKVKKQIVSKDQEASDTTPVTYSRRQRFNFKNKNDGNDDEDGPPFPYEGLQCGTCRCSCCAAGLRRNAKCECKCCQTMGHMRRCNSFDEHPVGKNPEIRRILCPDEHRAKKLEECDKIMPEASGMYKFDTSTGKFERQVPRTPTPIILEVPAPRRLNKKELQDISKALAIQKQQYNKQQCPVEAEPLYLPPIYGQCTPWCNQDGGGGDEGQSHKDSSYQKRASVHSPSVDLSNASGSHTATVKATAKKAPTPVKVVKNKKKTTKAHKPKPKKPSQTSNHDVEYAIRHHGHKKHSGSDSESTSLPSS